jgi:ABC-type branched-subunit amino acid transport system permease subunit
MIGDGVRAGSNKVTIPHGYNRQQLVLAPLLTPAPIKKKSENFMDTFMQQIINGLVLGSMYALVALGYTMVYGIIGLINFAHGEVLMVGALTSWTAIGYMQDALPQAPGYVILLLSLVIACVVAACLNFVIEKSGLPAPAQQPQTGAAHHGYWRVPSCCRRWP